MIDQALISAGITAIAEIAKALQAHAAGTLTADEARAQMQIAHDKLAANDAAADTALDAKFKGSPK
jgi:hypothetical protein